MRGALFQQARGVIQDFGPSLRRRSAPRFKSGAGRYDGVACRLRIGVDDVPGIGAARSDRRDQIVQRRAVTELDTARIAPLRLIEIARAADVRMPGVG